MQPLGIVSYLKYRPLVTRSLNARGALEAAPRGDTPSDCLIVADSSPIPQIKGLGYNNTHTSKTLSSLSLQGQPKLCEASQDFT